MTEAPRSQRPPPTLLASAAGEFLHHPPFRCRGGGVRGSDDAAWLDPQGLGGTRFVSARGIETELARAAQFKHLPEDVGLRAYVQTVLREEAVDRRQSPASVARVLGYFFTTPECRRLERRRGQPTLRQAALAVALWTGVCDTAVHADCTLDSVDVWYNAAACTLLERPCMACAAMTRRPAMSHDRAFGIQRRSPCCLPLRIGDVLEVPQNIIVRHMQHPMVYVGGGCIVHMTLRGPTGFSDTTGFISAIPLLRQRSASRLHVRHARVAAAQSSAAMVSRMTRFRRALACLGTWRYNAIFSNCEHFIVDVMGVPYAPPSLEQGSAVVIPLLLLAVAIVCWILASLIVPAVRKLRRRTS